jgi:hypothetical protein
LFHPKVPRGVQHRSGESEECCGEHGG